jgi:hypothetical protein
VGLHDLQTNAAVLELVFAESATLEPGFEAALFHRVDLQKPVQVLLLAPEGTNIRHAELTALAFRRNFLYCLSSLF